MADYDEETGKILRRLESMELRLSRLESVLKITENESFSEPDEQTETANPVLNTIVSTEEEKGLESQIGRFGLAWLGNIVLLFGITFLTQYMMNLGFRFFSILLGYLASSTILFLANYLKKANVHLAFIFRMNAQVLLFYITVRLHFFSVTPLIPG
jgi:uncharacterized membrane protein